MLRRTKILFFLSYAIVNSANGQKWCSNLIRPFAIMYAVWHCLNSWVNWLKEVSVKVFQSKRALEKSLTVYLFIRNIFVLKLALLHSETSKLKFRFIITIQTFMAHFHPQDVSFFCDIICNCSKKNAFLHIQNSCIRLDYSLQITRLQNLHMKNQNSNNNKTENNLTRIIS